MNMHLLARMLVLIIAAVGLTGCSVTTAKENDLIENSETHLGVTTSLTGKNSESEFSVTASQAESNPESEPSAATPSTEVLLESDPLPNAPYELDDIRCHDMVAGAKKIEHWSDRLIPGESSIDNLQELVDFYGDNPIYSGPWEYRAGNVRLLFLDGILRTKSDPRRQLGDIVLEYGPPEQLVWHIPRVAYHLAKYDTILLYPNIHTIFYTEEQVINFGWETGFEYSSIVTAERYIELVAQYRPTENDDYQFFMWPCLES